MTRQETDSYHDDIFSELEHLASTIVPSGKQIDRLESGERRNVTILFLHVGGEAEKDRLQQINEKLLAVFDRVVQKHGGYVDKHFADGLMALFGAVKATGRDASVAVACALEIQSRMKAANEVLSQAGIELGVRTGINTGEVAVGGVGAEREEDFTAYGDAVNTAKRFEAACPYGEIYIGDSSRELASTAFEYADVGELELKGKAEPVRAWKVKGRSAAVTRRWERKAPVKLGRTFAGRKEELAAFEEIVARARSRVDSERVPRMTPGAPKALVAAVRGDAGIGKSRLIEQFVKGSKERGTLSVMEHRGEAVRTAGAPYQVLSSAICHFAGTAPLASDSPEKVAEALATLKEESAGTTEGDSLAENLDRIRYLSGDSSAASSIEGLDASALQTALMIAFRSFLEASAVAQQAKGSVAVFIADDVQWADKASLEIIHGVLDSLAGHLPIYAIVMSRPEWVVPEKWRKSQELSEFELKPLPEDAADVQLEGLLGEDAEIPDNERKWLFARAQGNPFYLEELVLGATRAGALKRAGGKWQSTDTLASVGLPPTLDELILGHIDSVGDELRVLLQRAAVVGQPFWSNIVSHIYEALKERGEISPKLASLIDLDLIYSETEMAGDAGAVELPYFFRHVLLKDGAYKMLLKVNRKVLHRLAAVAIEEIHAEKLEPFYDPLAYHWEEAGYPFEAAKFLLEAAKEKSVNDTAHSQEDRCSRGIELCKSTTLRLPMEPARSGHDETKDKVSIEEIIGELLIYRGNARYANAKLDEAKADYDNALEIAPNDKTVIDARNALSWLYINVSNYSEAMDEAMVACAFAKEVEFTGGLAESLGAIGVINFGLGDFREALRYHEESLAINSELGFKNGIAQSHYSIGNVYERLGDYPKARGYFVKSLTISRETGNKVGVAKSMEGLAGLLFRLNDYLGAIEYYEKSIGIHREMGSKIGISRGLSSIGLMKSKLREYKQAMMYYEKCLIFRREIGDPGGIAHMLNLMGDIHTKLGNLTEALACLEQSLALRTEIGDKYAIKGTFSCIAEAYAGMHNQLKALKYRKKAVNIAREIGDKSGLAMGLTNIGVSLSSMGDYAQAIENYAESIPIIRDLGDKLALAQSLSNAAGVFEVLGDIGEALAYSCESISIGTELLDACETGWGLQKAGTIARLISENSRGDGYSRLSLKLLRIAEDKDGIFHAAVDLGWASFEALDFKEARMYLNIVDKVPHAALLEYKSAYEALHAQLAVKKGLLAEAVEKANGIVCEYEPSQDIYAAQTARIRAAQVYLACAKSDPKRPDAKELIKKAQRLLGGALEKAEETGRKIDLPNINNALATACELRGDSEAAEKHRAKTEEIRESFLPDPEEKERLFSELDRLVGEVEAKFLKNEEQ